MLTRARCLSFFFAKTAILCHVGHTRLRPLLHGCSHHHFKPTTYSPYIKDRIFMNKSAHFSNLALSATNKYISESSAAAKTMSNKARKKARRESPEGVLRFKLDMCSKRGDVVEALRLYDEARSLGVPLSQHNYNVLLYLCSCSGSNGDENVVNLALKRGFEIFKQMGVDGIEPNEATFTSAARLACAMEDPEMAFNLVKQMKSCGIPPKLRSYGPPLFGFCKKGDANRAYEVDAHMVESGVVAEEPELCALLGLSVESRWVDQVYEMMHRLRASVRQVSESTAEVVERWFNSEDAAGVGEENWDVGKVREGVVKGGGGWHGQGWLGKGKWKVVRTEMDEAGVCQSCGEKLVGIDIDPRETENFASSLTKLACQREVKADFVQFQEWLQWHGPFDAVVDGANVSLINQKSFSFFELNSVVNCLRQISPSKQLPLVILHRSRVTGGPAQNPNNEKLIQSWKKSGALYATPAGSNDDWYWLYAAVNGNCLLVTNDEMRDHLFQLLGTSFFPRWKEKHQVRLTMTRRGPVLHMPPPYSIVIQILPNTGMTSLDSVLTQGINMKKKHEVEVLSAVVDSIANSVGADTIVDVGAGQVGPVLSSSVFQFCTGDPNVETA